MAGTTAENILRAISGGITSIAPLAPGEWRVAMTAIGAAADLIAGLIAAGVDPHVAITEMRSVMPDYNAARDRLKKLIDEKAKT